MAKNDKPAAKDTGTGGQGAAKGQDQDGTASSREPAASRDLAGAWTSTRGLAVSSNLDGFRRAGLIWNRLPTVVKLSDLTDDQIKQLAADPSLTIIGVNVPEEDDDQS